MKYFREINFNRIKEFIIRRKYIVIIVLVLLILSIILIPVIINRDNTNIVEETTYNEINELIDKKETFIVYYYNSKSSNKYNKKIKKYLDDNDINYYIYDDNEVDKKEYDKFLKSLNIDKTLFGSPAVIYIKEGGMYSNLINIDSIDTLEQYIKDYDLVTIK